jgi:hypothetical protein
VIAETAVDPTPGVAWRRLPYPYRAMLAICSDLDETPDRHVYLEIARYLNTHRMTSMGPGVGLEVGNSIYFDMPPGQFAYWNTDDEGRAMIRALIRSGHIDCFHSFGDLATTRGHAGRALDELARHACRVEVWIDHAVAPTNFGADIMRGTGDLPGSVAYHADLTCGFGIRYVWRGRVTSVIGQDVARRVTGIFRRKHPVSSARTLGKELAKGVLARLGSAKYAMHAANQVLRKTRLRDGRPVHEFLRSNPHWEAVDRGETAEGLADVLSGPVLGRLMDREAFMVLYTHLGKIRKREEPLPSRTREALGRLAALYREGRILVTTTRRLLDHCLGVREASFRALPTAGGLTIDVTVPFEGVALSFYVPEPERTRVRVNGREVVGLRRNGPDHTGRPSVSIPWAPLEFPEL